MNRTALIAAFALCFPAPLQAADEPLRVTAPAALVPAATAIADAYATQYGRPVEVSARGSRDGIAALRAGQADVALSDSASGDETLSQTTVAWTPVALIADPNVGISSLHSDDVRGILDGTIVSWRSLGGRDLRIARFERPAGSAADRVLTTALRLSPRRSRGEVDDTSAAVVGDVKATPGGLGVIVIPYAGDLASVRVLAIDGRLPDASGIHDGYPLLGAEFAITLGTPTLGISRFIAFLRSSSERWREHSLIPVRDRPAS